MVKFSRFGVAQIFLAAALAVIGVGCNDGEPSSSSNTNTAQSTPAPAASATPASPKPAAKPAQKPVNPPVNDGAARRSYEEALDKGYSAASISQTAQSPEDWQLVESQWQEAIKLLKTVPASSTQNKLAKSKIAEYQKNLASAKQQAARATTRSKTELAGIEVPLIPSTSDAASRSSSSYGSSGKGGSRPGVFLAPIKRRAGGTAVIEVTFNGWQTFDMIVDTGASGTVITSKMASVLGVFPEGSMIADTPSAKSVTFPIGRVDSLEVGGALVNNVPVAIASQLDIGLLGQDFFGGYDVTFREDVVEFHSR
ncbi:retropepsin-like aspartic protease [Microcoleus sp. FACHB-68]|uniref:retropepsin-like aspartic protease family protein n=1 Tax=Microcoleus sp. FACHB-68 TaxID=2692826 RepID=UPI00168A05FE|nr:retropepsin-like aspartic protease [Microcoleus sp. FACHB-68]MBD1936036.1 retroviral-like aspartic protease family protein [Microcoleus sp. FACHB-68]